MQNAVVLLLQLVVVALPVPPPTVYAEFGSGVGLGNYHRGLARARGFHDGAVGGELRAGRQPRVGQDPCQVRQLLVRYSDVIISSSIYITKLN